MQGLYLAILGVRALESIATSPITTTAKTGRKRDIHSRICRREERPHQGYAKRDVGELKSQHTSIPKNSVGSVLKVRNMIEQKKPKSEGSRHPHRVRAKTHCHVPYPKAPGLFSPKPTTLHLETLAPKTLRVVGALGYVRSAFNTSLSMHIHIHIHIYIYVYIYIYTQHKHTRICCIYIYIHI